MANSSAAGRTFYKDLVALQAALRNPAFDKENNAFKQNGKVYRYASLAAHLDAVRPVITKHGFAITQLIQGRDGNLEVTTQLVHESGEVMGATIAVPLPTGGAHAIMGMITYLRRGQMASLLGIVGDDDNDGNEVAEPKAQQGARMPQERPAPAKPELTDEELVSRLEAVRARQGVERAMTGKGLPSRKFSKDAAETYTGRVAQVYQNNAPKPHRIMLEDGTVLKAWNRENVTTQLNALVAGEEYRFFYQMVPGKPPHGDDMFLTGNLFEVSKPAEVESDGIPF